MKFVCSVLSTLNYSQLYYFVYNIFDKLLIFSKFFFQKCKLLQQWGRGRLERLVAVIAPLWTCRNKAGGGFQKREILCERNNWMAFYTSTYQTNITVYAFLFNFIIVESNQCIFKYICSYIIKHSHLLWVEIRNFFVYIWLTYIFKIEPWYK